MRTNLQKRFLLIDEGDKTYTDLIEFKEETDINKIIEEIERVKREKNDSYTNEDIYEAIDKVNNEYEIIFLGNYQEVYY